MSRAGAILPLFAVPLALIGREKGRFAVDVVVVGLEGGMVICRLMAAARAVERDGWG